jgi:hypothetical protein|uniref:Uncharacterized protein n=1 Tax=Myoviridae sp. ctNQV2 TaxID=2827683 RepID=A0A8S5RZK7_9CAUD|nr:MAG: hypothetical protein [Bacteriophage sp.]DAF44189.1 MAG TPA: hypothetical protein [Myoviridae sp. ctNQV2]
MEGILYAPYVDYNSTDSFDYKNQAYDENYMDYLRKEYVKYKFTIDTVTKASLVNDRVSMINSLANNRKENVNPNNKIHYSYYQAPVKLLDIYSDSESFDKLLYYFKSGEMFPLIIEFFDIQKVPELESDFKMWVRETNKINTARGLTDVERLKYLPVKDLKVSFGPNSNAVLEKCKLLEVYSVNTYAVSVNKIIFVR